MKQRFLLSIGAISVAIILMSGLTNAAHSPGAKTGSPADGANCTKCHAGTTQTATNWITTNIPSSGYVPGATYTITLTGNHSGVVKFGFELTAENASMTKMGMFTITNATETQLTNMMHAVTHTGNGLTPSNNSKSWSFDWTAPMSGSGDITFYAALNAANGNSSTSGDVIYNTNTTVSEDLTIGFDNLNKHKELTIFPNPAIEKLSIRLGVSGTYQLSILDLSGKLLIAQEITTQSGSYQLNVSKLTEGTYYLQIEGEGTSYSKQFVKQ